jgi:hypothetical protein
MITGDHPTDWATRYVKAQALREAAATIMGDWSVDNDVALQAVDWLNNRANEIEQP